MNQTQQAESHNLSEADATDDTLKAAFLAEIDDDRRWALLVTLHDRGWAYRPFNHSEPFARRRGYQPEPSGGER